MKQMELDEGKYTVQIDGYSVAVLRYGTPWRDFTGDKFIGSALAELMAWREYAEAHNIPPLVDWS